MKIQLHHAPGSAAMAPHILLTEIGADFELSRSTPRPAPTRARPT